MMMAIMMIFCLNVSPICVKSFGSGNGDCDDDHDNGDDACYADNEDDDDNHNDFLSHPSVSKVLK